MKRTKTPDQKLAGTANQEARFARVLRAAGDDPASLLLMISVMERILAEGRSRRRTTRRKEIY